MTDTDDAVQVSALGPNTYRASYDRTAVSPSYATIVALSEATGVPQLELGPLGEDIDTDALNTLLDGGTSDVASASISFRFEGYSVTVEGDGFIAIDQVSENSDSPDLAAR